MTRILFISSFLIAAMLQAAETPGIAELLQNNNDTRVVLYRNGNEGWRVATTASPNPLKHMNEPIEIKYARRSLDANGQLVPAQTSGWLLARWESFLRPETPGYHADYPSDVEFRSKRPEDENTVSKVFNFAVWQNHHSQGGGNYKISKRHFKHHETASDSAPHRTHFKFPDVVGPAGSVYRTVHLMDIAPGLKLDTGGFTKSISEEINKVRLHLYEVSDNPGNADPRMFTLEFIPSP